MTESSQRLKRSSRAGIAAVSTIALALGGISVVGPGPLAPSAAAATLSGGIREKSGAVEKDAQQASDLKAGSCVVSGGEKSGSQAGFSWNTLEPGPATPSKTLWGLSVAFDNSKDRTFTDWSFSSSDNLSKVLDTGQVSSMEAGQTFIDKDVTRKADEIIDITASGRDLRNLNLYAELTDEKVKQFASATAGNPVRYAWQSNYKQDNPYGPNATRGSSATFGATVNPWPSENIECNPITVSWENWQKHVIVPGSEGETKVGTINVPPVEGDGGGKDDSMSRMVVEAYDGNGKFIGTTDPEVSGGEQLLRVDETTGEIFFTWPEYRGTDLATDKNVNFSVLAKPRTVDQLQAATEHNNGGIGNAFDSSNSLDRYSKANVIDSKAFSLDDTEYHDPKYDKTDASIISGVDSATGPLATEPQKVTFTQIPDLIKDLTKDKGEGGYEAKVSLDEKYVYEGWSVDIDEDYNVTVTAPENPKPGTFARPVVTVEYSNGSTDRLELLVVVDPNNTQVTDLVRPGLTKGKIGDDLTAQVGTKSIMKGHKPVHPAKFEVDPSTVPEGWTVTVDETGKVTAKADDTVAPGTIITPTVKATYPDQTTDEIETQFQAIVDIKVPDYDTVTNKPNAKVSLQPSIPEVGLSGNTTDEAPKRYTFEGGETEYTHTDDSGKWKVKIDENTGEITTTIPRTAPEGYILNVPVLAYYDNADKPQQVKGTVVVLKGDIAPVYSVESTSPNQAVDHQVEDAPKGSKFSFGKNPDGSPITEMTTDDGWKYTIDPKTGVVSSTPPADSKPGDKKTINVTVDTPAGSSPKVPVTTVVNLANNWEADPSYPEETVYPGDTAKSPLSIQKPEGINLAEGKPFEIAPLPDTFTATGENNEFGNPTYTVTTPNGDWIVGLDNDGNVISTAPGTAQPDDEIKVPVTVTYEDGSKDTTTAVVKVVDVPEREVPFDVKYKYDATVNQGTYKVETEGVPGAEKMNKDGKWDRTKEPVNEVVVIGTKPMSEEVKWKEPIPFSTTVRENPDLAPGETRVVQEGKNGEASYAAVFNGVNGEATVTETNARTEPVERIVEYGPRLDAQELVTKTEKPVPFETEIVFDDSLPAGEQVVDQQGELGTEVVTSTQKIVDGQPSGDPEVTTERTKEPTNAKIRVGTKTTGETSETVTSEVPFGVKVEFDPNMPAGTSETVTEGKPGKKTITVTQKVTNSQPDGEATVEEKVTEQPVDQVIKVGTKPSEASEKVTWTAQVPFEVETRPNPELKPGEIKVVQKGVPGEKTYSADFSAKGDQATVTPEEKQTKDPVNEIIEYGPGLDDQELVTTVKKPVPFETEIVFDDSLEEGKQEVKQVGRLGEDTVTSTQKLVDGKPSGDPVVETTRTEEPIKQIIRVGTKTTGTNTETFKTEAPYKVVVEYDPNMPAGTSEVTTPGVPGEKTVTIERDITNSTPGKPTISEEITKQPVDEVITVGTKQATATESVEWTEPIPFGTTLRPNPELKPGETKVVQEGKNGEASYAAVFTGTNGEATVKETKARTEPVEQIIEYGPGAEDSEVVTKTEKPVPFETEIVFDDSLPAGEQVVDQQGELGTEVVTSTQKIVDGQPSGDPEVTTERTKEPTNAKIRVGTKTTGTNTETVEAEVPFDVKVIYDPSLKPGESKVTQEGKPGKKNVTIERDIVNSKPGDPKITEEIIEEPVEKIVTVGTKPAEATNKATWVAPLPYDTIVRVNPELKPGEMKVVQEGEYGEKEFTADFTAKDNTSTVNTTEKVTKQPVQQIIEYGPKADDSEVVTKTEKPVPFETEIVFDDSLPAGEQVVDKQGELGTEVVTSTQKIVDGQPSGDPEVTTERTKEPTNAKIRVGTKTEAVTENVEWTEKTPYETEIRVNPDLQPGETKVVQEGTPGEIKHTVKVTVDNGKVDKDESTEKISDSSPRIIEVGPAQNIETELTDKYTEEIPYETIIEYDPNLEAGKVEEDQAGVIGEKEVSKTWKLVDGQPVGEPETSETVTKEKQDRKIRVGTKCNCETPVDPTDPTDPTQPTDPTDPTQPTDPTDPTQPTEPTEPGKDGSSETAKRCFGNAVRSPLLWLLPIGLLVQIGGKLAQPYIGQVQGQLNALNAQIQEEIRRNTPDFGFGHHGHDNEQFNEIVRRVNAANAQLQGYANDPAIQKIGQGAGVILAMVAAGAVLYDWCSSPVGDAKTSIGGDGSSKSGEGESAEGSSSSKQDNGSSSKENGSSRNEAAEN